MPDPRDLLEGADRDPLGGRIADPLLGADAAILLPPKSIYI